MLCVHHCRFINSQWYWREGCAVIEPVAVAMMQALSVNSINTKTQNAGNALANGSTTWASAGNSH